MANMPSLNKSSSVSVVMGDHSYNGSLPSFPESLIVTASPSEASCSILSILEDHSNVEPIQEMSSQDDELINDSTDIDKIIEKYLCTNKEQNSTDNRPDDFTSLLDDENEISNDFSGDDPSTLSSANIIGQNSNWIGTKGILRSAGLTKKTLSPSEEIMYRVHRTTLSILSKLRQM
ncbi:hypothetical protein HHI36_019786 [Cryptolaemus montrouzieri]|uniref:Uncharacterized protein n=1 Tax=Cryptolaemus montrouzieri TaxID=559131 RepID=A0ABD2N9J2_9CUCU